MAGEGEPCPVSKKAFLLYYEIIKIDAIVKNRLFWIIISIFLRLLQQVPQAWEMARFFPRLWMSFHGNISSLFVGCRRCHLNKLLNSIDLFLAAVSALITVSVRPFFSITEIAASVVPPGDVTCFRS